MSTRTENRPALSPTTSPGCPPPTPSPLPDEDGGVLPPQPAPGRRARVLDLSLAQVLGGSFAAATASAAGSRLGVVGTISGAAVISVVASVASAFYTTSLRHTGRHVSSVLRRGAGPTVTRGPAGPQPAGRGPDIRRLLAGAAVVFALAALAVTGVELVTGRSLDGGTGTTLSRTVRGATGAGVGPAVTGPEGRSGRGAALTPSTDPTPTVTPSQTPTPTATPSAPASPDASAPAAGPVTPSASPTGDASPAPTASSDPSTSPSADPTPSASPSASATDPSGTPIGGDAADGAGAGPLSP